MQYDFRWHIKIMDRRGYEKGIMKKGKNKDFNQLMGTSVEDLKTIIVNRFLNWLIGGAVAVGLMSLLFVVFFS